MIFSYFNGDERARIAAILSDIYKVDTCDTETKELLLDFIAALDNGEIISPEEEE